MGKFPWQSPYCAFDNNPIFYTDPLGLAAEGGDDQDKKNEKEAKSQGLPDDAKHEQVSTGKNGKQYQYVVGDNGKGSWGNYDGEAVKITPGNKGGDAAQESKPEENHSMMNSFFGVSSDGSSATDKISVYDQSNYDYCNSNPTILQNRLEANNRENGLLTYAGVSLAAPFAIFGIIETAPVWMPALRTYHSTIGVNGGYANIGLNWLNQSYTQGGNVSNYLSFEGKSITGLLMAGSLSYSSTIGGQMAIGAADPWASINYSSNGFYGDGYFLNSTNKPSFQKTTALSIMGAFGPLYQLAPLSNTGSVNFIIEQLLMAPGQKAITNGTK
jgi:hypothetical protein